MADEPIPLSLPAILINPKNPALAHLHQPAKSHRPRSPKLVPFPKRVEGRRTRIRRENDSLAFNPHATPPSRLDVPLTPHHLPPPTFPSPLPPSLLPRTRPAPSPEPPTSDPASSEAGSFSLSLKGIRKTLQRRGTRAEHLVRLVEDELVRWVEDVRREVVLLPSRRPLAVESARVVDPYEVPMSAVGRTTGELMGVDLVCRGFEKDGVCPAIVELARNEGCLTWAIAEGFERYVVHCISRYHNLLSFSKTSSSGTRLTYILLRPSTRPHGQPRRPIGASLDTPPTTDMSSVGGSGTDTDVAGGPGWGGWDSEDERGEEAEEERERVRLYPSTAGFVETAPPSLGGLEEEAAEGLEADVESSDDESVEDSNALAASMASMDFVRVDKVEERSGGLEDPIRSAEPLCVLLLEGEEEEDPDRTITSTPFPEPVVRLQVEDAARGKGGKSANGRGSFWQFVYG